MSRVLMTGVVAVAMMSAVACVWADGSRAFPSDRSRGVGAGGAAYAQYPGIAPQMEPMMPGPADPTAIPGQVQPAPSSPFGTPPGRGAAPARAPVDTAEVTRPLNFIVIPLIRGNPETIGYAIQADDIIYDEGAGGMGGMGGVGGYGGYGSHGRTTGGYDGTTHGTTRGTSTRGGTTRGTTYGDYGGTTTTRGGRTSTRDRW